MKTVKELSDILQTCPWGRVDAHVHTHLCDGQPEMTVRNIGDRAEKWGIELVILTPHCHRQVSDETETLYEDTDENIFTLLRDEIDFYHRQNGKVQFLLSTETDILSPQGDLSLSPSSVVEKALDLITPTMNYNPILPLCGVHLTYGRDIDRLHESGEYTHMEEAAGGIPAVLEAMYTAEEQAVLKAPYPSMLGHFFAAHSVATTRYNWFGIRREHLPILNAGAEKVMDACRKTGAMVDVTGIHMYYETVTHKREKDGFLYEFQKNFLRRCREEGIQTYPGSDAHHLDGIGESMIYTELFEG